MSKSLSETAAAPPSFEAAMAELENIVATMESGQLPLADSLAAYKRGVLKAFAPDASAPPADDEP